MNTEQSSSRYIEAESLSDAIEQLYKLGWTDGLPVVPPTTELVQQFMDEADIKPDTILGEIPERRRIITAHKVAANAVMSGAKAEYFPVILAATKAILHPDFNLIGPSSSLGGAGVMLVINGPLALKLGINSRNNLFGPGNRANATIGRALRLIMMNACASVPGLFDRSVLGHPGKYSYCIAEAESETHWSPLHVERGFDPDESTVTAFACEGPRQVRTSGNPEMILGTIADVASALGTSLSTVGSTSETTSIVRQGELAIVISGNSRIWSDWSKSDIKKLLQSKIMRSLADLKRAGEIKEHLVVGDEDVMVPLINAPDDLLILFAGGEEKTMGAVIPSWGPKVASRSVTMPITVNKATD